MWESFVDVIRASLVTGAHVFGGSLGGSVIAMSLLVRLALLPVALRMARQALVQQRRLAELRPQIERLHRRWQHDPARLMREDAAFRARHGVRMFDPRMLITAGVQLPLIGGLYSALRSGLAANVRFAWIADLARPDAVLIGLVVSLTAGAALATPTATTPTAAAGVFAAIAAVGTLLFLASTSSALALSVGAGSAVSLLQNVLLRRSVVPATPAR